jgi:hypothetical protein
MTTAQTLITDAYIESRVSDATDGPESEELTVGLRFLNRIIGRLSTRNILIPYSTTESFSVDANNVSYTMGSGGTASSTRARRITSAFVRDSSGYDTPVGIISEKDYNRITDKDLTGKPRVLFYDPVYAIGEIYVFPKPDQTYSMVIESDKDLHSTLLIGTTVSLPSEYEDALVLTLAAKIARANGAPTEASLIADAQSAWKGIANMNFSQRVPVANLPFSGSSSSKDLFNSSSGFSYIFPFILG